MDDLSKLLATPEPPQLGPGPREGVLSERTLNRSLDDFFKNAKVPAGKQDVLRALVLLWHDHLDAAHEIAQSVDNADGAFVHGIMHRREPDYGNAAYWFRRVGRHAVFLELGRRAGEFLAREKQDILAAILIPRGEWDAFGFISACEQAAADRGAADGAQRLLRKIQSLETQVLASWLVGK